MIVGNEDFDFTGHFVSPRLRRVAPAKSSRRSLRVKTPTLMLHGKYDTGLPYETSIKPMYDLMGTPAEHKKLKLYETDHIAPKNDFIKEILAWLDRYLGPVK